MNVRLGLAVLALALAAALLLWPTSGRGRRVEPEAEETQPSREGAALEDEPAPARVEPAARQEDVPLRTAVEHATGPAAAAAPVEPVRLRGILVHSSDRRPAAGARLAFHSGDESTQAVTAADGRFETESAVPSGEVRVWHMEDASDRDYAVHLDIEPEVVLLSEPGLDGAFDDLELALVDPPAWLAIEVFDARGVPTAAELRWLSRSSEHTTRGSRSRTDAQGRARLPFPGLDPGARMSFLAHTESGLVSDVATIQGPPPEAPVRLEVDAGGSIRALAVAADGQPLEGERINLRGASENMLQALFDGATTDASGVGTLTQVPPGSYTVDFWHDGTSEWIDAAVEVERGRTSEVELRASQVPLAVAGRVVDQDDQPLEGIQVFANFEDGGVTTETDEKGAFSIGTRWGGTVRVSTAAEIWSDRFEPAFIEVPCGTRDLLFRRVDVRPERSLTLEIVERGTVERIPEAMVLGFVMPWRDGWSFHRAPAGLVTLELKLYEDVWLSIEAPGHRRRELRALDLVQAGPEGGVLRVALEPGLERTLLVFDQDGRALLGARIWDGDRLLATTDGDGRASIDLPTWPLELRITAEAQADAIWTCRDWLAELDGAVWMEPRSEEATGD